MAVGFLCVVSKQEAAGTLPQTISRARMFMVHTDPLHPAQHSASRILPGSLSPRSCCSWLVSTLLGNGELSLSVLVFPLAGDGSKWLMATYESISDGEQPYSQKPRPILKSSYSSSSCTQHLHSIFLLSGFSWSCCCRYGAVVVGRRSSHLLVCSLASIVICKPDVVNSLTDTTSWMMLCSWEVTLLVCQPNYSLSLTVTGTAQLQRTLKMWLVEESTCTCANQTSAVCPLFIANECFSDFLVSTSVPNTQLTQLNVSPFVVIDCRLYTACIRYSQFFVLYFYANRFFEHQVPSTLLVRDVCDWIHISINCFFTSFLWVLDLFLSTPLRCSDLSA